VILRFVLWNLAPTRARELIGNEQFSRLGLAFE
jgi:hypothetical protein